MRHNKHDKLARRDDQPSNGKPKRAELQLQATKVRLMMLQRVPNRNLFLTHEQGKQPRKDLGRFDKQRTELRRNNTRMMDDTTLDYKIDADLRGQIETTTDRIDTKQDKENDARKQGTRDIRDTFN